AAAVALPAVVTRRPAIEGPGDHREPPRHAGDVLLLRGVHHQQLIGTRARRWQEDPVRRIGNPFLAAEEAYQPVELVVIGTDVGIADGPVGGESVEIAPTEVIGPEPEGDAAPVIGASAHHPRPPPPE